jgi:hypothetical protein
MEMFLNLLLQDDVLLKAIEKADADVEKAKRDADEKKWRIIADLMKGTSPLNSALSSQPPNFSQNACRDCFEALQAGTAHATPSRPQTLTSKPSRASKSCQEKEQKIRNDAHFITPDAHNIEGNAWSRMRTYY